MSFDELPPGSLPPHTATEEDVAPGAAQEPSGQHQRPYQLKLLQTGVLDRSGHALSRKRFQLPLKLL